MLSSRYVVPPNSVYTKDLDLPISHNVAFPNPTLCYKAFRQQNAQALAERSVIECMITVWGLYMADRHAYRCRRKRIQLGYPLKFDPTDPRDRPGVIYKDMRSFQDACFYFQAEANYIRHSLDYKNAVFAYMDYERARLYLGERTIASLVKNWDKWVAGEASLDDLFDCMSAKEIEEFKKAMKESRDEALNFRRLRRN